MAALDTVASRFGSGTVNIDKSRATVPVTESLTLAALGPFTIHTTLDLHLLRGHWLIEWSRGTIDPALGTNGHFSVSLSWPARAAVLAADGAPISPSSPASVVVGLYGTYIKSPSSLSASLVAAGAPATAVATAIARAKASPRTFEPVFTVPWTRYEQLRPTLYPVAGVFFQGVGGPSSSTPVDLVGVVGTLGAITKAELKNLGAPYSATSVVGQGGIEQAHEQQLAGSPGITIAVLSPAGAVEETLATKPAKPGTPVRTTIEPSIETAAANALATAPNEAALVAIQASTGKIVAVANNAGGDLALEGEQPPGSTMKVITSTALISRPRRRPPAPRRSTSTARTFTTPARRARTPCCRPSPSRATRPSSG